MASRRLDISSLLCDDNQPAFSPLEVLVQAATEERKRLGAADDPQQHRQNAPSDTRQRPLNDNDGPSPRLSPHLSRHHIDDPPRTHPPQQPLYLQRRPHHDNLTYPQYPHHSPSSQDFDFSLEADRRRRLQEAEHQQRLQQKQRIQELEYQRQQEQERAYRTQELERRRREEDHLRALEYQRELGRREAERQQQLAEEKQREPEETQFGTFEIERHRAVSQKQHPQQFVNELRQYDSERRDMQFPSRLSPVVASGLVPHLISNPDPPRITQSTPSVSPDSSVNLSHHDSRPIKRRRYSVSPTRHNDQEHNRNPTVVGELSYGKVDSSVASSSAHRRPGSHNQPRKAVAVADPLADMEPTLPMQSHPDPQKILSPTSRRSPPGSQIGRAKAARKSDELIASLREHVQPPPPKTKEHVRSPILTEIAKDPKIKQEPKPNRLGYGLHSPSIDDFPQKKALPHPASSESIQRDDPHEFFLHQYDQVPTADPASLPSLSNNPISPTPSVSAVPVAVALDKELEDLISSPTSSRALSSSAPTSAKRQEGSDDMDLAMKELVETVENGGEKHIGMEVDVEDELLSLVDDRPPPIANPLRRLSAQQQQVINRNANDHLHPSSPTTSSASTSVQAAGSVVRSSAVHATSDRDSMPPPAIKRTAENVDSIVTTKPSSMVNATGEKNTGKFSNVKSKTSAATTKPKAKTSTKVKRAPAKSNSNAAAGTTPPTKGGKKTTGSTPGSRPTSVIPSSTSNAEAEAAKSAREEEEEEDEEACNEDDKLYCLCKTKYDESRFMIACDKCDEWYHTLCVNMPDLDVDLVDQFFCPSCIEKNPQSNLRSTYKQRCIWGLCHPNPESPKACHKAARGAFSKYCSDECGIKYMQSRVDNWAKKGGKTDILWEGVKNAERREGIVVCAVDSQMDTESGAVGHLVKQKIVRPSKTKTERETERLNNLLGSIVKIREDIQRGMEIIVCRERLLQLASERAEHVGQCGWDQRLCCDDEEMADIGAGMLESYEDAKVEGVKEENGDTDMEGDGHDEQWWCPGKKVCDRHAGWQTIRYKDVCKEKEMKEDALAKLTLRECDLRKRIEDIHDPHANNTKKSAPLKASTTKLVNGFVKPKVTEKKGKKRKAPSH